MAAATACASTALAGQSLLKPVNELARQVGTSEARITMRRTQQKSSDSIWYATLSITPDFDVGVAMGH